MKSNNDHTALLVMDIQTSVLAGMTETATILTNINKAIAYAHSHNIMVIFIIVGFRNGVPEVSADNKMLAGIKERSAGINLHEMSKVHPGVVSDPQEIIVIKHRISAFVGTDLELILRAQSIRHLILTGVSTSGVVLSTLREAADRDYRITVLKDCCMDRDEAVHQILVEKVFVLQAEVTDLNNLVE
ncbi:isochorismatase family cysteine hydrolase [Mucilaginibacter sp. PAMB04274]|uniref:cysteine hydrolase family protein n=1 Tax=Mucilaginibacter sp. PAMB04274 TaxID=3138568 RepID=UPI0031F696E7